MIRVWGINNQPSDKSHDRGVMNDEMSDESRMM
jgi:hypothetical protein